MSIKHNKYVVKNSSIFMSASENLLDESEWFISKIRILLSRNTIVVSPLAVRITPDDYAIPYEYKYNRFI